MNNSVGAIRAEQYFVTTKREFVTGGVRFVEHMEFLEVVSFLGEGVGAALFLLGSALDNLWAMMAGVALVGLAVIALMAHLGGRALIAWRAVTRVKTSWVARGTLFISLFMATSLLLLAAELFFDLGGFQRYLEILADGLAVLVVLYAGMMLRSMKAVTLWRTLFLPASFIAHSGLSALIIYIALFCSESNQEQQSLLVNLAVVLAVLTLFISAAYIASIKRTIAVKASLDALLRGAVQRWYLLGAGLTGVVIPCGLLMLAIMINDFAGMAAWLLISAAVLRLFGDYAYRYAIVKAGAYEPVVPVVGQRGGAFSR
ncbi:MAG: dimethyl sulfoxide reductase anchor subunit [Pseudomonadales bacterium]|nr:dimethyl sulfoxide reductase anchor subunit [Pseudomonadales bacterium]MCP5171135.1 dimethyl sulfoxide reductase anchor subunit [Pseudomonadales bacterium]MCP5301628.1 dimethyl sulfoxide reductase anchor subunit [Pseudomonadales bacterium]